MSALQAKFNLQLADFHLNVDIHIPEQGVTAIFGPSGSGKTTLLRLIAGLERTDQGYLSVHGESWQSKNHFMPAHDRPIGYVFQDARLFPHLNVRQNLVYGLQRIPAKDRKVSLDDLIERMDIAHLLERKPDRLSGGEQQRVAIARALALSPKLLMMDEPLASLDQALKREILPYLERLHATLEIPVLYVSHDFSEVTRLADHLLLMQSGQVLAAGPASELITRLDLPLAHGHDAEAVIEAIIEHHDPHDELSRVAFNGGHLSLPLLPQAVGQSVRVRILARDVSITLTPQTGTSIINILPATVLDIAESGTSQNVVALGIGEARILARLTRRSVELLALKPGLQVYAQIKGIAILD